jgi:hypothetical protein
LAVDYDKNKNAIVLLDPVRGEIAMPLLNFKKAGAKVHNFTLLAVPKGLKNQRGDKMRCSFKMFRFALSLSIIFLSACKKSGSPSTTDQNYLYLTVKQNNPSCPLILTVTGPTSFQDVVGPSATNNSLIAFDIGAGNYYFYFNGTNDGVAHYLSGPETIKCFPTSSSSCAGWSTAFYPS